MIRLILLFPYYVALHIISIYLFVVNIIISLTETNFDRNFFDIYQEILDKHYKL